MGLLFVPIYIHYLGMESFALVGFFGMLQAWLALFDMGMKPALSRELARFSAGHHNPDFIRDLLRSVMLVAMAMASLIAVCVWAASGWLATEWLSGRDLSTGVIRTSITLMGLVVASRLVESLYVNCLVGLQRQVTQNAWGAALATLRGVGVIAVLAWVSPTIQAFFVWQGMVSLLSIGVFSYQVYRSLPGASRPAEFSFTALKHVWRFARGMLVITLLALALTQVDKILLSRLLTLEAFGYYVLASMVAAALRLIPTPITTAIYPRFSELVARGEGEARLRTLYHHSAQLITVLMGSAAIVLAVFSHSILALWTANPDVAAESAPILRILALGTLFNGLMWVPYQLQLAHGWTALGIRINTIAVVILVPGLFLVVPRYGSIGAAWTWLALNVGYMGFTANFMHRRLLIGEKWRWYIWDISIPLIAATAVVLLCYWAIPTDLGKAAQIFSLVVASGLVLASAAFAAPLIRQQGIFHLLSLLNRLRSKPQ